VFEEGVRALVARVCSALGGTVSVEGSATTGATHMSFSRFVQIYKYKYKIYL
jgi:hypothetical protein